MVGILFTSSGILVHFIIKTRYSANEVAKCKISLLLLVLQSIYFPLDSFYLEADAEGELNIR